MLATALLVSLVTSAPTAGWQDETEDNDIQRITEIVNREMKVEYQQLLLDAMRMRIRALEKHAKLNPKDARRLMLAAKGASKKLVDKHAQKIGQYAAQPLPEGNITINGRLVRLEQNKPDQEDEEEQDLSTITNRVVLIVRSSGVSLDIKQDNGSSGYGLPGGYNSILSSDLWKDTLAKVTTKEQLAELAKFENEQRRQRTVNLMTAAMTMELQLDDEQVPPFHEWLDAQIEIVREADLQSGPMWAVRRVGRNLKTDGLDEILAKEQVAILSRRIAEWE
jgi:ribosomal protein S15P/S13E